VYIPAPEIYFAFRGRLASLLARPELWGLTFAFLPQESSYISSAKLDHCSSLGLIVLVMSQPPEWVKLVNFVLAAYTLLRPIPPLFFRSILQLSYCRLHLMLSAPCQLKAQQKSIIRQSQWAD